jgi:hypothetical protein
VLLIAMASVEEIRQPEYSAGMTLLAMKRAVENPA